MPRIPDISPTVTGSQWVAVDHHGDQPVQFFKGRERARTPIVVDLSNTDRNNRQGTSFRVTLDTHLRFKNWRMYGSEVYDNILNNNNNNNIFLGPSKPDPMWIV